MYPHYWARYRATDDGECWDTWHYDGEPETFTDSAGRTWRRVAVTGQKYYSTERAVAELDRLEGEAPQC